MGLMLSEGGRLMIRNGKLFVDTNGTDCCCGSEGVCCVPSMPDVMYLHITTSSCASPNTYTITMNAVWDDNGKRERIWRGNGQFSDEGNTIFVQIYASCNDGNDNITFLFCHDTCLSGTYECDDVSKPFDQADWTTFDNVSESAEGCLAAEHTSVPISSCDTNCEVLFEFNDTP